MYGLMCGFFSLLQIAKDGIREIKQNDYSINAAMTRGQDYYINSKGQFVDLKTNKKFIDHIYNQDYEKQHYEISYYNSENGPHWCLTQHGDCLQVFYKSKDNICRNYTEEHRRKLMKFFRENPDLGVSVVTYGNSDHRNEPVIGKRYRDINNDAVYVIRSSPYELGDIGFYCDLYKRKVVRKTDYQLKLDAENLLHYQKYGTWSDSNGAKYIDENETNKLIDILNKDITVMSLGQRTRNTRVFYYTPEQIYDESKKNKEEIW